MAVITYRLVKGSELTKEELDDNFHNLDDRVAALETDFVANPQITEFRVEGEQFFVDFDDYSTLGPYDLPVVVPNPRGAWQPATTYIKHDWIYFDDVTYAVIFNHVSQAEFDPNANDGLGNNYYEVVVPAQTGAAGIVNEAQAEIVLGLTYAGKFVECSNGSGTLATVPRDVTVNHAIGTEIHLASASLAGNISIEPETGVVDLLWPVGFLPQTDTRGAVVTVKKIASNKWRIFGLLAPDPSF